MFRANPRQKRKHTEALSTEQISTLTSLTTSIKKYSAWVASQVSAIPMLPFKYPKASFIIGLGLLARNQYHYDALTNISEFELYTYLPENSYSFLHSYNYYVADEINPAIPGCENFRILEGNPLTAEITFFAEYHPQHEYTISCIESLSKIKGGNHTILLESDVAGSVLACNQKGFTVSPNRSCVGWDEFNRRKYREFEYFHVCYFDQLNQAKIAYEEYRYQPWYTDEIFYDFLYRWRLSLDLNYPTNTRSQPNKKFSFEEYCGLRILNDTTDQYFCCVHQHKRALDLLLTKYFEFSGKHYNSTFDIIIHFNNLIEIRDTFDTENEFEPELEAKSVLESNKELAKTIKSTKDPFVYVSAGSGHLTKLSLFKKLAVTHLKKELKEIKKESNRDYSILIMKQE